VGSRVQFGPLGTVATIRPIVPAPGDYDDGEIGEKIGSGNWSTQRKSAPMPLCPPQTPYAVQTRTLPAAVGSQWLTAWATARPRPYRDSNSDLSVVQPVASSYTDCAISARLSSLWYVSILSFLLYLAVLFSSNIQSDPVILIEFFMCLLAETK
jgi:hypothetical protein